MEKETKTGIEVVLFDYGMVLSGPPKAAATRRMEALLHSDAVRFHVAYWKFRDDYDRGRLTGETYWSRVAQQLGRTIDTATVEALLEADTDQWTQPNQPMIAWAAALQRRGVKTGILSNLGDAMEIGIRARLPWLSDFAHPMFSHRLGIAKPDAAIYEQAVAVMDVRAEAVLFLDDKMENVEAARRAGMQAIEYGEHGGFLATMRALGYGKLLGD